MSSKSATPPAPASKRFQPADTTRHVFKDASELPRSKPDYVVMSPTPLGLRPVPPLEPRTKSK
jgi:hypothetical protein